MLLAQLLTLLTPFIFVILITALGLFSFMSVFVGIFTFAYLLIMLSKRKAKQARPGIPGLNDLLSQMMVTLVVLLLLLLTGSLSSPLFFLLYLLSFSIGFTLMPEMVFVFSLLVLLFFLPGLKETDATGNILKLGSFILLSPLAYFFGKEYREKQRFDEAETARTQATLEATEQIRTDVSQLLKDEKDTLKPEDVERLNDILEETEEIRDKN